MIFIRECRINYPRSDIGWLPMSNIADCISLCAVLNLGPQGVLGSCVGVGWVYAGLQGTENNYCWFKSQKGLSNVETDVEAAWLVK
jgi:hypothetical protein